MYVGVDQAGQQREVAEVDVAGRVQGLAVTGDGRDGRPADRDGRRPGALRQYRPPGPDNQVKPHLAGHQNSTASNPAERAAAGRFSSGSSVNKIEQLTSNRRP